MISPATFGTVACILAAATICGSTAPDEHLKALLSPASLQKDMFNAECNATVCNECCDGYCLTTSGQYFYETDLMTKDSFSYPHTQCLCSKTAKFIRRSLCYTHNNKPPHPSQGGDYSQVQAYEDCQTNCSALVGQNPPAIRGEANGHGPPPPPMIYGALCDTQIGGQPRRLCYCVTFPFQPMQLFNGWGNAGWPPPPPLPPPTGWGQNGGWAWNGPPHYPSPSGWPAPPPPPPPVNGWPAPPPTPTTPPTPMNGWPAHPPIPTTTPPIPTNGWPEPIPTNGWSFPPPPNSPPGNGWPYGWPVPPPLLPVNGWPAPYNTSWNGWNDGVGWTYEGWGALHQQNGWGQGNLGDLNWMEEKAPPFGGVVHGPPKIPSTVPEKPKNPTKKPSKGPVHSGTTPSKGPAGEKVPSRVPARPIGHPPAARPQNSHLSVQVKEEVNQNHHKDKTENIIQQDLTPKQTN